MRNSLLAGLGFSWGAGVWYNPLEVIAQITSLLFIKRLGELQLPACLSPSQRDVDVFGIPATGRPPGAR